MLSAYEFNLFISNGVINALSSSEVIVRFGAIWDEFSERGDVASMTEREVEESNFLNASYARSDMNRCRKSICQLDL
jgi:hypothetical protein